jgi:hypothetical protein
MALPVPEGFRTMVEMSSGGPIPVGPEASRRRSQRVFLSVPVIVRVQEGLGNSGFEEETQTMIVNAHGALILLAARVTKGQKLRMTNRSTKAEQMCRVASFGPKTDGKTQVGIEFVKPSPDFWQISFPPEDWAVPEPSSAT